MIEGRAEKLLDKQSFKPQTQISKTDEPIKNLRVHIYTKYAGRNQIRDEPEAKEHVMFPLTMVLRKTDHGKGRSENMTVVL